MINLFVWYRLFFNGISTAYGIFKAAMFDYNHIRTRVIQYVRGIFPKELTKGNAGYSFTSLKEINSYESFHVQEDCQPNRLYYLLRLELLLYQRVSVFSLHGLSLRLRLVLTNPCLAYL